MSVYIIPHCAPGAALPGFALYLVTPGVMWQSWQVVFHYILLLSIQYMYFQELIR